MDHFALPIDDLFLAWKSGKLHRNFMGYTTQNSGLLLGLGVSSISDTGNAFAQNEKALSDYYARIQSGKLAVKKGYFLNAEDLAFRKYIRDICCKGETRFLPEHLPVLETYCFPVLADLAKDGLLTCDTEGMKLTSQGHYFIRNVCSAFDLYLRKGGGMENKPIFSRAI